MKLMKFTTAVIAVLPILAAAHPTARDPDQFNELNFPLPHNYVANAIFAGQELRKNIARPPGDNYTEETWTELARRLCFDTSSFTTLQSYLFGTSGALKGTGDEMWFAYLYAGPTSNINDWERSEGASISHQRIFTSIYD
ncbi:hypothetical protein MY11210_004096 [Beauveria gryllotalpidicola]